MKFRAINTPELLSPATGVTITDILNVPGVHQKAFSMMSGYSIRRQTDDMLMNQFKFVTKAIRDNENSTTANTRFVVTTKIIHFGDEDNWLFNDEDTLLYSYSILIVIP